MPGTTDATGTASCVIEAVSSSLGPQAVGVTFAGNSSYEPSADNSKQAIVFAFPSRGSFVLGDHDLEVGQPVLGQRRPDRRGEDRSRVRAQPGERRNGDDHRHVLLIADRRPSTRTKMWPSMTVVYSAREDETRWLAGRRAVVLLLLVAVPLVFDTSVTPTFALPKFTVAAVGAALALTLAVAEWLRRRSPVPWRTGLTGPVLLVVGWAAVSAAASSDRATSVFGARESINGLATVVVFAVVFWTVAGTFAGASHLKLALWALWYGGGTGVLLYGALQLHGEWDPIPWVPIENVGVIWSTLGNPNDLGGFLAIILPVGLVLLVLARHPVARAVTACMIVLLVVELVVTTSRGAALAAAAAVVAVVGSLRHEERRRASLRPVLVVTLLGASLGAATLFAVSDRTARGPGDLLETGEGTTTSLRAELWGTAWRMAVEHPLVGVGPEGFGRAFDASRSDEFVALYGPELLATDAHNVVLTRLAEQGFPGGIALVALVGSGFWLLLSAGRRLAGSPSTEATYLVLVAVAAGLVAYVVQATFNRHDIALDFCFWVLLGLACAVAQSGAAAGPEQGGEGHEDGHRSYS